ncbi:hypothetical protein WAE61_01990 [Comamonadaceae bacterium PP-2]
MAGLVLELQRDSLDRDVNIAVLLRKAIVISKKLDLNDIEQWLGLELNGYADVSFDELQRIAPYRVVKGDLKCFNPYHGWQPLDTSDPHMAEVLRTKSIGQAVGSLEDILRTAEDMLYIKFEGQQRHALMRMMSIPLEPAISFPRQTVVGVLESVRNRILEWSLQLEKEGVLGSGLSFSKDEKEAASAVNYTTVNNIGAMHHSQLQLHSSGSQSIVVERGVEQAGKIVEAISSVMSALKLSEDLTKELQAELETLRVQLASPKPKTSVVKECLLSVKTILEGAAGNVVASGIALQIPAVIAALA